MADNIYTFVDANGVLTEVAAPQLNFVGAYSPLITYYRFDVVTSGLANFVCLTQNLAQPPPLSRQFNSFWSILAFTSVGTSSGGGGGGGGGGGSSGTVPGWVMSWIGQTYNLAVAGTEAANSADSWARDAFSIAVNGTNAANQAYTLAQQAYTIAIAGTNTANNLIDSIVTDLAGNVVVNSNGNVVSMLI